MPGAAVVLPPGKCNPQRCLIAPLLALCLCRVLTCHGMQVLKAFITVPQSSLLGYTATDKGPTSDVVRNVAHKSMSYKVPSLSCNLSCKPC